MALIRLFDSSMEFSDLGMVVLSEPFLYVNVTLAFSNNIFHNLVSYSLLLKSDMVLS
jgi:hypothetical protein